MKPPILGALACALALVSHSDAALISQGQFVNVGGTTDPGLSFRWQLHDSTLPTSDFQLQVYNDSSIDSQVTSVFAQTMGLDFVDYKNSSRVGPTTRTQFFWYDGTVFPTLGPITLPYAPDGAWERRPDEHFDENGINPLEYAALFFDAEGTGSVLLALEVRDIGDAGGTATFIGTTAVPVQNVPEPSSTVLVAAATLGLLVRRRT